MRCWLGARYTMAATELTVDTPLLGLPQQDVLTHIVEMGFCALDVAGMVLTFQQDSVVGRNSDSSVLICLTHPRQVGVRIQC